MLLSRNTNESSISDPTPKEMQNIGVQKIIKSTHKVLQQEDEVSGSGNESTVHAMSGPAPKPWNPPSGLKFPCPLTNHNHEVSTCAEFFSFSPLDHQEKIEKGRMCFSCMKQRSISKTRKCDNVASVPDI